MAYPGAMKRDAVSIFLAALSLAGCSRTAETSAAAAGPPKGDRPDVVAEVDGEKISRAELEKRAAPQLSRLRQEEHDALSAALEQAITEKLLEKEAKARGTTTAALLQQEVEQKTAKVDPKEVDALFEANRHRLGGRTREEVTPEIERVLADRRRSERTQAFHQELRRKASVKTHLVPPRAEVPVPADAPVLGPADAPVTMVAFADYQCGYCRRAQVTIDQVMKKYEGKVRLVHRDYLLSAGSRGRYGARASYCAGEQGKFWDFHRGLLLSSSDLSDADLKKRAAEMGLDRAAFDACYASERYDARIAKGQEDGVALGVTGTPAFFINGRLIGGAHPLESFVSVIDAELAK